MTMKPGQISTTSVLRAAPHTYNKYSVLNGRIWSPDRKLIIEYFMTMKTGQIYTTSVLRAAN